MLLENLLKLTPEDDERYPKLAEAVDVVCQVAQGMNSFVRDRENRQKVAELSIQWNSYFVTPSRVYLHDGILYKQRVGGFSREYHCLLFNDLLVYGTKRPIGSIFNSEHTMSLKFNVPLEECLLIYSNIGYYSDCQSTANGVKLDQYDTQEVSKLTKFQLEVFTREANSKEISAKTLHILTISGKLLCLKSRKIKTIEVWVQKFIFAFHELAQRQKSFGAMRSGKS